MICSPVLRAKLSFRETQGMANRRTVTPSLPLGLLGSHVVSQGWSEVPEVSVLRSMLTLSAISDIIILDSYSC